MDAELAVISWVLSRVGIDDPKNHLDLLLQMMD